MLDSDTFKALSTAPMGLPKAMPVVGSPAKRSATALLLASTMGDPESPAAANAVAGAVGETMTWPLNVAVPQAAPYATGIVTLIAVTVPSVQLVVRPFF